MLKNCTSIPVKHDKAASETWGYASQSLPSTAYTIRNSSILSGTHARQIDVRLILRSKTGRAAHTKARRRKPQCRIRKLSRVCMCALRARGYSGADDNIESVTVNQSWGKTARTYVRDIFVHKTYLPLSLPRRIFTTRPAPLTLRPYHLESSASVPQLSLRSQPSPPFD